MMLLAAYLSSETKTKIKFPFMAHEPWVAFSPGMEQTGHEPATATPSLPWGASHLRVITGTR